MRKDTPKARDELLVTVTVEVFIKLLLRLGRSLGDIGTQLPSHWERGMTIVL